MSRRDLPRVDELADAAEDAGAGRLPRAVVIDAARTLLAEARDDAAGAAAGKPPPLTELAGELAERLRGAVGLTRVVNATGVLLHTNLGRAPVPRDLPAGPAGSVDLELDLVTGRRGGRLGGLEASLRALTGAEAALVVNNNAAAVLLALSAVAPGREVVVSRGQLVEIGGSFRVPEIVTQGGAELVEVGTTNRTHESDFRAALGERTGALLEVHPSNYRVEGFTASVPTARLARLAREARCPLVVDLGGGLADRRCAWLADGRPPWLADEPGVAETVASGADVVTFSGDKLLGGPQAGIVVGRRRVVEAMRAHPLARALRFDRTRAPWLHAVVDAHLDRSAGTTVPFWRRATAAVADLEVRAEVLAAGIADRRCAVAAAVARVGAGAAPGHDLDDVALRLAPGPGTPADAMAGAARRREVPVLGVVRDGALWFHLRTVDPTEDADLAAAARAALAAGDG